MSASSSTSLQHPSGCKCDSCEITLVRSSLSATKTLRHILSSGKSLTRQGKGRGFDGLKPIRVKLFQTLQTVSSGAASALIINTNVVLNAATFPELANFGVVYDQIRMLGVKLHYFPYISTPGSAPVVSPACFSLQFDPNIGNPASVSAELEESYNSGLMLISPGVNGATNQSSNFHTKFLSFHAKAPKLAPITGDDCPGSNWIVIDASTAPTMVVLSGYAVPLGTGGIISMYYSVELDVELRMRT